LYKNGVLLASATGTTIASYNQGFRILNDDSASPTFGVNGLVGEVCVWNRPLGSAEIYDLYRRGNGAIGRELTGQTRRRTYGFVAAGFRPYWAARRTQIIGGGVR
jgi:hypothetical protein